MYMKNIIVFLENTVFNRNSKIELYRLRCIIILTNQNSSENTIYNNIIAFFANIRVISIET